MRETKPLDALMPRTRQRILAVLYGDASREWYLSDLARRLEVRPSSLQRELAALVAGGILRRRADGNRGYYAAETSSPIFPELHGLFLKTAGLRDVLAGCLQPLRERIDVAFVHGSIARQEEGPGSDVDLMVIGRLGLAELALALKTAEEKLLRPVNPSIYTPEEVAKKISERHHFLITVSSREKLFVVGDQHDLEAVTQFQPGPAARHKQVGAG